MADPKFSNYGLPDEVAYPRRAESIVMRSVRIVGHDQAESSVQRIRKMAGRPDVVLHTYDVWSDAANNLVGSSANVLTQTLANLEGWWSGPAYTAFSDYLKGDNGPLQASRSNAGHMINVCKQLLQAYSEIIDTYNHSVLKMAEVAVLLNKYAPWKIQNMFKNSENVTNALTDFANTVSKWETERRSSIRNYVVNSKQAMSEIQQIMPPNEFPSVTLNPKKWHVQYE